jgi:diacylglycerol kinase family enzyme
MIDVGVVNDEVFAVMAGTGFDALMIRDVDDADKARFGQLSYLWAAARHLKRPATGVQVDVDGERWFQGRAACVLVGNVGRVVGGVDVFPDAMLGDGRLDVGIVTAQRRRDWVRVGARAVFGRIDHSPFVQMTSAASLRIKLDHKLPWQLDGGDRKPRKRLEMSVLPCRIPIMVPAR